jgi:hypothetical protein
MGDFRQNLPPSKEYLLLSFSPSSIPLQQRWRNNCLSADFLANYLSTFFLGDDEQQPYTTKQAEVKSAVSYIANELLENGMKYCVKTASFPISIQIHRIGWHFEPLVNNSTAISVTTMVQLLI